MSIFDLFVAEVEFFISHPIYILTALLPCLLGIFILIKLIDFILYYYALNMYLSDDDKGDKKDD